MDNRIVLIGCGGIGSWLAAPLLAACITELDELDTLEFVVVDGDKFEPTNISRQNYYPQQNSLNKAYSIYTDLCQRVENFDVVDVTCVGEFVSYKNIMDIVRDGDIVITGIDDLVSRKIIHDHMVNMLDTFCLITVGNELNDGTCSFTAKQDGELLTHRIEVLHPEYRNPKGKPRGEMSCDEIAELPGGGQIIATNFLAAAWALSSAYEIIKTTNWFKNKIDTFNMRDLYFFQNTFSTNMKRKHSDEDELIKLG